MSPTVGPDEWPRPGEDWTMMRLREAESALAAARSLNDKLVAELEAEREKVKRLEEQSYRRTAVLARYVFDAQVEEDVRWLNGHLTGEAAQRFDRHIGRVADILDANGDNLAEYDPAKGSPS